MLNPPIPAFVQGVPVRVYDVLPDGHCLVAHADGQTALIAWVRLRLDPAERPAKTDKPARVESR